MARGFLPGLREDGPAGGPPPITLEFWNVFEDRDIYAEIIAEFKTQNPNVTINYKKIDYSEYRQKLTEAMAKGAPPDIFAIHNTWLPIQKERIGPAPQSLASVVQFKTIFPKVVEFDFARETEAGGVIVYALPLSIETLGIFYNKDYFDAANITAPPKTWEELLDYTKVFTQLDDSGNIILSGISLGTTDNINRANDILALLMMQSGARMNNELLTEATFDDEIVKGEGKDREVFMPGKDALEFYLAFSDNTKSVYSWSKDMNYSIDAFAEGKSAMMINYPHHIKTVKGKAPHLNFSVAGAPQLRDRKEDVNYANYWGLTVSDRSLNANIAWKFIDFMLEPENLKKYSQISGLPVSRRDLILVQQSDAELKPFANQIISARSWYQGDSDVAESIFRDMIQSSMVGEVIPQEALEEAAARVTLAIQKVLE